MTTIVVPLDGSKLAEAAVGVATRLAALRGGRVHLVGVAPDDDRQPIQDRLTPAPTGRADDVAIEVAVVDLQPQEQVADAIIRFVRSLPDAMLCMSAHGRTGLGAAILGSTTEAVLRRLGRPVLVVGPDCEVDWDRHHAMVIPLDGSGRAERILPFAASISRSWKLTPWLVQVAHPFDNEVAQHAEHALERPRAELKAHGVEAKIDFKWASNAPACICAETRSIGAALIVMPTFLPKGISRTLVGSVTMGVIHRAPCPVPGVPARDAGGRFERPARGLRQRAMTIELAGPGAPVMAVETHTADLLLTGTCVLKIKKPVRFAFLDYTTREQRLEACRREVELNQRLAPDVYLGVADIAGPDGQPWDHAVVMRRLPADRSLDHLMAEHRLAPEAIGAIARQLASFHASARRGPDVDEVAGWAGVHRLWVDNLAEMRALAARTPSSARPTPEVVDQARLDQVEALAEGYLAGRQTLWRERLAAGAACDGHGDLQAADIFWLEDGPRILDCIEFDDRYRFADVVADLAFLAMDLERLGAPEAARELVDEYVAASAEPVPPSLLDHYIGYRALVRAKVADHPRHPGGRPDRSRRGSPPGPRPGGALPEPPATSAGAARGGGRRPRNRQVHAGPDLEARLAPTGATSGPCTATWSARSSPGSRPRRWPPSTSIPGSTAPS